MSISVIEARQKSANSQVTTNGDWENILLDRVVLETGDTLNLNFVSVDTTESAGGNIFIDTPTEVEMSYVYYAQLDHVNAPSQSYAFSTATQNNAEGSNTVCMIGGTRNPFVDHDSPSVLSKYYQGASHHRRLDAFTFSHINPAQPIPECNIQLEFRSPRFQANGILRSTNRITLKITERAAIGASDIINKFQLTSAELGLDHGYVMYADGISLLNEAWARKHNLRFHPLDTQVTVVDINTPVLIPIQRIFKTIIPKGRYAPSDLAQFLTRKMSAQTQNSLTTIAGAGPPPFGWPGGVTSVLLGNDYQYSSGGKIWDDSDFYLGNHFFSNFSNFEGFKSATTPSTTADFDLKDFFSFSNEGLAQIGLDTTTELRRQIFSYMPTDDANTTDGKYSWMKQRNIGSSQGPELTFNTDSNKFEWSLMHAPYINMSAAQQGQMGYARVYSQVADKITGLGVTQAFPEYPQGALTNLGGVAWTCLHPIELFEDILGFDTYDSTIQLTISSSIIEDNTLHAFSGFAQFDSTTNTAPYYPYIAVGLNTIPHTQGQKSMRNFFSGKCMTDLYLAKSDVTDYISQEAVGGATPTPAVADTTYIFNVVPFAHKWTGTWRFDATWDILIPGATSGVNVYSPGTEGQSTNLQNIRAKNFASGTQLSSAYYLIEIDGISKTSFIGDDQYSRVIAGLVNRYYSNGQYTSGAESFQYTHQSDKPLIIDSLRIRILNPDGTLATTIGEDNSIMLQVNKTQTNVAKEQIPLLDKFSTKKQIAKVKQETKEL